MKIKRIIPVLGIVTIMGTTGAMSFASGDQAADTSANTEASQQTECPFGDGVRKFDGSGKSGRGNRGNKGGKGFKGERPELTEEEKAEMKARREEHLAQALAEGKITQEQYDKMMSMVSEGKMRRFGGEGSNEGNTGLRQRDGAGLGNGSGQGNGAKQKGNAGQNGNN